MPRFTKLDLSQFGLAVVMALALALPLSAQSIPDGAFKEGWAKTLESRRSQARDWLREVSELDNQIPTLSPAESAWLTVEYDDELRRSGGTYSPRSIRASQSKEFAAREAKPIAKRLTAILTELSSSKQLSQRSELILWTELSWRTLDLGFWGNISTLGEAGLISRKQPTPDGGYQMLFMTYWAMRVSEIHRLITQPYLESSK